MAMNVTPFVGTDNFNMETFNNMISQINNGVNNEIAEVFTQLGTKTRIQAGSYVGTGTFGPNNPCSLTFDFEIDALFIIRVGNGAFTTLGGNNADLALLKQGKNYAMYANLLTTDYVNGVGLGEINMTNSSTSSFGKKSSDGKTFYWYNAYVNSGANGSDQFNSVDVTYTWLALGHG